MTPRRSAAEQPCCSRRMQYTLLTFPLQWPTGTLTEPDTERRCDVYRHVGHPAGTRNWCRNCRPWWRRLDEPA